MSVKGIMVPLLPCCVAVALSAVPESAAQAPQVPPKHAATDKAKPPSEIAAKCQAMMAEREQMMTEMKAADQSVE